MEQRKATGTALTVAIQRAIHQLVDDPKVLVDPVAERLVEAAAAPGVLQRELKAADLPRWRRRRAGPQPPASRFPLT